MNEFVYNNKVFYFDSAKYSPFGNNNNHYYPPNTIINYYSVNKENFQPKEINLVIKVIKVPKKQKLKETVAGKGHVAAKFLNKIR